MKQDYEELCSRNKEENVRWEKKAEEAKREGDLWKIINRERKKRGRINEGIEEWKEYFMRLLERMEEKMERGVSRGSG